MENKKPQTKINVKINDVRISYTKHEETYTRFSAGVKRFDKKNPEAKVYDNFTCFLKGGAEVNDGDILDISGILSIGEYNGKPNFTISVTDFQKKGEATKTITSEDLPF